MGVTILLYTAVLHDSLVLQSTNMQLLRVCDESRRRENGPNGTGAVEAFAETPLALSELTGPARYIVCRCIAQDVIHGIGLGHVLGRFRKNDCELRLVVGTVVLECEFRNDSRCRVRARQRSRRLTSKNSQRWSMEWASSVRTETKRALEEPPY